MVSPNDMSLMISDDLDKDEMKSVSSFSPQISTPTIANS